MSDLIPAAEVADTDVVQLCMTGTLFKQITAQLVGRGLRVDPFPVEDDELPTYMVGIGQELWDKVNAR